MDIPLFWIIGAVLGGLAGLGGVATNPSGYYSNNPVRALGGALLTIGLGTVVGAFLIGATAWLLFDVTLPLLF